MHRNKPQLEWLRCDRCRGDLPVIDGDNAHDSLPKGLKYQGDCPGSVTDHHICGAYEGWSFERIERYVQRRGVKVT